MIDKHLPSCRHREPVPGTVKGHGTKATAWKVLKKRRVFSATPWFSVERQTVELPDGNIVRDYHRIKMPRTAIIMAVTTQKRIIVLESYRHGVGSVCLTLPGGVLGARETPLAAAKRELLEETGYVSSDWHNLGSFVLHSNYGCGQDNFFFAGKARRERSPDAGDLEDSAVLLLSRTEMKDALLKGRFPFPSIVALMGLSMIGGHI